MSELSVSRLSPGLLEFIDDARLTANFERMYDQEMPYLAPELLRYVDTAIEVVLQVPLVHATHDPADIQAMLSTGIIPYADRPEDSTGHTRPIDASLGLDTYSFMFYGNLRENQYGQERLLVDAGILQSGSTVVTPNDIAAYVTPDNQQHSFDDQDPALQDLVMNSYIGRMLRGEDWITIAALKAIRSANITRGDPFPLSAMHHAEVKHLGTVPSDAVVGSLSANEVADYEDTMLARGIMSASIYGQLQRGYPGDRFSQENLEQGRQVWRNILDIDSDTPPYAYRGRRL